MANEKKTSVVVTATQPSRWRIGRQFGPTPSEPFDVTDEELQRLNDDPKLVVAAAPAPAEEPKKGK